MAKPIVSIECPCCKSRLYSSDAHAQLTLGQDEKTVSVYVDIFCDVCAAPVLFTYMQISDMVNLNDVEVDNG